MSSRDYLAARQLDIKEMPFRERQRQAWARMNQELLTFLHEQGPYSSGYPESSARGMWAEPVQGKGFMDKAKEAEEQLGYVAPMLFPKVGLPVFAADMARRAAPGVMNPLYAGLYTMRKLPPWNDPRGYQDYMAALESLPVQEQEMNEWMFPESTSVMRPKRGVRDFEEKNLFAYGPGRRLDPNEPGLQASARWLGDEEAIRREAAREYLESQIPMGVSMTPRPAAPVQPGSVAVMEMRRNLFNKSRFAPTGRYDYSPQGIMPR